MFIRQGNAVLFQPDSSGKEYQCVMKKQEGGDEQEGTKRLGEFRRERHAEKKIDDMKVFSFLKRVFNCIKNGNRR